MDYDYEWGVNPSSIELDEPVVEFLRCTCLDRGRIALERSGQVTCSHILKRLQIQFDEMAEYMHADPNRPCEMLDMIMREWADEKRR